MAAPGKMAAFAKVHKGVKDRMDVHTPCSTIVFPLPSCLKQGVP